VVVEKLPDQCQQEHETMYKLLEVSDGNVIREHTLTEGILRIGRNPGNDIQPDDASVSGSHAAISVTPSPYMDDVMDVRIEDLGSTNGTRINGTVVKKQLLKHSDMVTLGTLTLKFIDENALALDGTRILLTE
jgi:pSer/pThr/pTyr-binding forkhead associated (FHA) protein